MDLKINDIINDDQQDLISANVNYCNDEINLQKVNLL